MLQHVHACPAEAPSLMARAEPFDRPPGLIVPSLAILSWQLPLCMSKEAENCYSWGAEEGPPRSQEPPSELLVKLGRAGWGGESCCLQA